MSNYLIFGGSGFIGFHLTMHIQEFFDGEAFIFDIENAKTTQVQFENVDVRKEIRTHAIPKSDDVIFNLAAVHRTPGHPSNEYFETNILGAENVCNYARKHHINTIVFTSSIAVYGTYEEQKSESKIPMPDIPYGISKLTAEYIHKLWQQEDPKNRKLIIVRPGVVFGENENGNFTRLINSLSKKRFFYPGRTDTKKGCIYVKDLVHSMTGMVEKEDVGVYIYNMTYDPSPSIMEICKTISATAEFGKPFIKLPSFVLLMIAKVFYFMFRNENFHPDRVRKLMISNDINGNKLKGKYPPKFGLEKGLKDWMETTNFRKGESNIY